MQILHVSTQGSDLASGSADTPFRHIQTAFNRAQPGDRIRVAAGIYRERVDPPQGGLSDECRITVEPLGDGEVILCGSETVRDWQPLGEDRWQTIIPHAFFGDFNPFTDLLRGHWFNDNGRPHHSAAVYLNGHWLSEAADEAELHNPPDNAPRWFAKVEASHTRLIAQFPQADPNRDLVEVNARQSVFYPSKPGIHFITVRGLTLRHAATPWAPPTTEQIGLIGSNWSRGWIIENCEISYAICSGVTLGKYHDPEDFGEQPIVEYTGKDTYHDTIHRALKNGWRIGNIGGHIVRRNHIHHCEMAGICGSFGALASQITDNHVHHIHVRRAFAGLEMAGIKFHGAIDTLIARNQVHHCNRGLWLDWMSQGTHVHANIFHHNGPDTDVFLEVNHGPMIMDHNLLLSPRALMDWSEGGLYAHNLFAGSLEPRAELGRQTPFHAPHSTEFLGMCNIRGGDHRILNNLCLPPADLKTYDAVDAFPNQIEGNISLEVVPQIQSTDEGWSLSIQADTPALVPAVSAETLGLCAVAKAPYVFPDGSPVQFTQDARGNPRAPGKTPAGPFSIWRDPYIFPEG